MQATCSLGPIGKSLWFSFPGLDAVVVARWGNKSLPRPVRNLAGKTVQLSDLVGIIPAIVAPYARANAAHGFVEVRAADAEWRIQIIATRDCRKPGDFNGGALDWLLAWAAEHLAYPAAGTAQAA